MSAIKAEAVSHFYGKGQLKKQILHDVNVEIPHGEIVIVTGPSGSGKTTLLTLIGALRSTQQGSLRVLDNELLGASKNTLAKLRTHIGFIFQQHNLLAAISAIENVELGLGVSGKYKGAELRKRAAHMLDAVGLGERMGHKPEQLSGGQRQRVAIARALASQPSMLLADEPTASLDKESGREVVEHMKHLATEQGTTILIVTHDNRILDVADRIVHLEDGVLTSFTDSVISNNKHMMGLLADANEKVDLSQELDQMDDSQFKGLLEEMSNESRRFIEATSIANDHAYRSMLERSLFAFTKKLAQIVHAERGSLFLVDQSDNSLVLKVTEELPIKEDIRIPINSGIVGAVVQSGQGILVEDAYEDNRFNRDVDAKTGYRTRSILALPIRNLKGEVFAAVQLLNRTDEQPFSQQDMAKIQATLSDLSLILEGWITEK